MPSWPNFASVALICCSFCSFSLCGCYLSDVQAPALGAFRSLTQREALPQPRCAIRGNISQRAKPKQGENGTYLPNRAAAKSGLNKSILDAGWDQFQQIVSHKAACAGRTVLKVNPRYTSQVCSQCGTVRKKDLSERWHFCECGCELDRDTNAAINILWLGRSQCGDAPRVEAQRL